MAWFERFFGARPGATFDLYVGLLNGGGCYGVSVAYENGREEVCPVIGAGRFDDAGLPLFDEGIEQTVVHELCHTYTNTFVDQFADQLQPAGERLFESCADKMPNWEYEFWLNRGKFNSFMSTDRVRLESVHVRFKTRS